MVTRRADAERNIAAILEAGRQVLSADPAASVAEIAKAAGVGRVTLYGHFPSRESLVEAVLTHAVELADGVLEELRLDDVPAPEALDRLVGSSWDVLGQHSRLFVAADATLPGELIREHHAGPLRRVERLIARGRDEGSFRTDLPLPWLVSTFLAVLHTAAAEVEAGRLDRAAAGETLTRTLRSLLRAS
ncbi:helix-turn-helix domain-containing protein [Nonomuraea sp. NPDC048916]|uniref:TetR/AcrR family transcriptional regulator n=1 Tax=Nonomuraea sp. NPDC048916 TaxID=3154232 RepID=UPI0034023E9E